MAQVTMTKTTTITNTALLLAAAGTAALAAAVAIVPIKLPSGTKTSALPEYAVRINVRDPNNALAMIPPGTQLAPGTLDIQITITNAGTGSAPASGAFVEVEDNGISPFPYTAATDLYPLLPSNRHRLFENFVIIPSLAAGSSYSFSRQIDISTWVDRDVSLLVTPDVLGIVGESDETNNTVEAGPFLVRLP